MIMCILHILEVNTVIADKQQILRSDYTSTELARTFVVPSSKQWGSMGNFPQRWKVYGLSEAR